MIPIQQAFLRDIREHPDDDTPRLIYSDWLEENGQPERAEFIRVQCELEQLRFAREARTGEYDARDGVDEEWGRVFSLVDREEILLRKHVERWITESIPPANQFGFPRQRIVTNGILLPDLHFYLFFRRGFINEIHARLKILMLRLQGLVNSNPIEKINAIDKKPYLSTYEPANYLWRIVDDSDLSFVVPLSIAKYLKGKRNSHWSEYYATQQEAINDLSRGILLWARDHQT
jgi:uncharacterized protein (TIGR02996 family)